MQLCTAVRLRDPSELCPETGFVKPNQLDNHLPKRITQNMFWPVTGIAINQGQQHPSNGNKDSITCLAYREGGPVLWPGFCTERSCADGVRHSLEWTSLTKTPASDATTCSIRPSSARNSVSTEKVSPVVERKQPWKRCAAHVYISHLIQTVQTVEKMGSCIIPSDKLKQKKSSLVANKNPNGRNGLNGVISSSSVNVSPTEKSLNDQRVGIPLEKRLQQDQKQTAMKSEIYAPKNQNCDFLSLSRNGSLEAGRSNNSSSKNRSNLVTNGLEQPTSLHVPYLHSLVQHHPLLPFSMSCIRYSSVPYPDQLAAAAQQIQLQLPQYLGNAGQEKQQQCSQPAHMLAAQQAIECRSVVIPRSHFPKWHSGRPENTLFIPCAQAIQPTTTPNSLEVGLGSNCSSGQRQLFRVSSSSSHRGKKQHSTFPAAMTRLVAGSSQLLCNAEHK